jgi:YbgC/YbaW family acyl-CoA thioester hydrolase
MHFLATHQGFPDQPLKRFLLGVVMFKCLKTGWTLMNDHATPQISTAVQVMFFDTDCAGVVHNLAYLRFIEVNRTLLAEDLGMPLVNMADRGTFPVVVRTEIDYKRPAKLGDRLVVEGRLALIARLRFWVEFEINRPIDGALIAQSRQTLCVIQLPGGKPVPLPADWMSRFAHLRR